MNGNQHASVLLCLEEAVRAHKEGKLVTFDVLIRLGPATGFDSGKYEYLRLRNMAGPGPDVPCSAGSGVGTDEETVMRRSQK